MSSLYYGTATDCFVKGKKIMLDVGHFVCFCFVFLNIQNQKDPESAATL